MRISGWSSDVCPSDLIADRGVAADAEIAVVVPVIIRIEAEGVGVARRQAVEMTIAGGQCQAAVIVLPAHAGADFGTAIATDGETRRGVVGLAGENMDNAADRIRTPQRRARAAHDFDALDLPGRQMREVEQTRTGGRHAHPLEPAQGDRKSAVEGKRG